MYLLCYEERAKDNICCCSDASFFSVFLITAYCLMMRSPTVLNVLPVGGDSRKQVMMIFVLAVIGRGSFYALCNWSVFSAQGPGTGNFLALGASRQILGRQLRREVGLISSLACVMGMALGTPFAWLVWSIFRLTLMDTPEWHCCLITEPMPSLSPFPCL